VTDAIVLRAVVLAGSVRVVHEPADGEPRTLASDVDLADSILRKGIGLMGRSSVPDDYALVFEFGTPTTRSVHMLFVRTPIDVVWTEGGEVQRVETLDAWTGRARARGDRFIELAPGAAADVAPGDRVVLEE
jgi:uncharacterized membrane protein (UPF0127 family)